MEKKNNVSNILYIMIILLLVIIIILMGYQLSQVKNSNAESIHELQNNLSSKETQINTLQDKISSISNTLDNTVPDENNSNTATQNTSIVDSTSDTHNYSQITQELDGIDVLYVTNAEKNNDNSYTLQGVIYTQYTISANELNQILDSNSIQLDKKNYLVKPNGNEFDVYDSSNYVLYKIKAKNSKEYYLECQAQLSDVWKLTTNYKEIVIPGNTICAGGFEPDTTVAENFKNYTPSTPEETTSPDASKTYSFIFQNGKCTKVVNALTSID